MVSKGPGFSCWFITAFLIVVTLPVYPQDNILKLSLQECEQLALKNSQKVTEAEMGIQISKAKRAQARSARFLPKFELRNIWGPIPESDGVLDPSGGFVIQQDTQTDIPEDLSYFTDLQIDLLQPLFTFGKLSGVSNAAQFGVEVEQANLEKKQQEVLFEIRKLYWGLVLGKELAKVVTDARNEMIKAENKIEEKLDEGDEDVAQNDLFKLQLFKYEVNKRYRQVFDEIELGKSALRTLLALDDTTRFDVAAEYLDPVEIHLDSLPVYVEMASLKRAEVSQFRAGLNARHALIDVSKSDYYPQIFLGGQIKYNYAPDRFDPSGQYIYNPTNFFRPGIVLGMNMNLNFWQTRNKVQIAQAEYTKLAQQEQFLLDGIKLEVLKTYTEVKQTASNMQESRQALKASDNWLRSASMTFDLGVSDVKDFIDAYKANGTMQAEHFENIFNYNVAIARLSKTVGRDLYKSRDLE